jgi:hypothetical protein
VNPADSAGPAPSLGKEFNFQFTYEHTAAAAATRDAAYRYAALPAQVDLSSPAEAAYEASAVTIPGLGMPTAAASVTIPATVVEWGVTIPTATRNRELAESFLGLLLGPTGRESLTTNGPAAIVPARANAEDRERLPATLLPLTVVEQRSPASRAR